MKKDSDIIDIETGSKKRYIVSAISAAACRFVLLIIYYALVKHDLFSERTRYSYIAKDEAEHIVTTIDCVMARANTLKVLIQDHDGDTSFFDDVAEDIYKNVTDETGITLKNFALAPDGVVSKVYPLKGNESLVGFDFRIGGDEFAALIHTKEDSIDRIADELQTVTKNWTGENVGELSLSVGYASHKEFPGATMETLIRTADKRMYEAKREYYRAPGVDRCLLNKGD